MEEFFVESTIDWIKYRQTNILLDALNMAKDEESYKIINTYINSHGNLIEFMKALIDLPSWYSQEEQDELADLWEDYDKCRQAIAHAKDGKKVYMRL